MLSNALAFTASVCAKRSADAPRQRCSRDASTDAGPISAVTSVLADYVAKTLDRELPAAVLAASKLHVLDTIAAIVSGSHSSPARFAARYVDSLGGKPQATVIGTRIVTSSVNAALANGMMGHADETDDTHPMGLSSRL